VSVTDAGRKVLEESHRRMVHAFSRALEGWSAGEIAALSESLDRLREDVHRDVVDGAKGVLT
jgi:DNA-binding MarR family transcriptional regulator